MTGDKKRMRSAFLFYVFSAPCVILYILALLHPKLQLQPAQQLFLLILFCVSFYTGSRLLCTLPHIRANRCMKITLWIFFLLYLLLLFTFTLFEPAFGRGGTSVTLFSDPAKWREEWRNACNLLPFSTIAAYIKAYRFHNIPFSVVATNLFGNLLALAPMALFLPLLCKRCRRFLPFLLTVSAVVLGIELLQLAFMVGSLDIDDLILNDLGACLLFFVLRRKSISRRLKKAMYME